MAKVFTLEASDDIFLRRRHPDGRDIMVQPPVISENEMGELMMLKRSCQACALKGLPVYWNGKQLAESDETGPVGILRIKHHLLPGGEMTL